ncbi:MAG: efflux RND transporter permease subunit [Candidatus Krumholzibacteriota bacterium]|nr:efflux RND transporter permease subunit [Candidatus Krumholzibacteriota bacterium]
MLLSNFSVRRPVFTTMLVVAFAVLGIFSYLRMSIELTPDIEFPYVVVTTIYPGAGPEEIETQVTGKIEDAVATIADLKELQSYSMESVSYVIMEFALEADVDDVANDVRGKVDAILADLPDGAEKPSVQKFDIGSFPIISVAVSSTRGRGINEIYAVADQMLRDRLAQVTGVANVDIIGGQEREIQVAVDPNKLELYGVSLAAVSAVLGAESANVPGGRVVQRDREFTVRTLGEFADLAEIGAVRVPANDGVVFLRDLAAIRDTYEEARSRSRYNGRPAVQVDVVKRSDANTVETAVGIRRAVEQLAAELPEDFVLEYAFDDSEFIEASIKDVLQNIFIGILVTAALLFLFLNNLRGTLIAAVVMPAAVVSAFLLMMGAGFTLNMMSLLALGVSVGVLVTNAIVVLENILRHLQMGKAPEEAARAGTDEVVLAVTASVMTNVVVFVPIAFMEGIIGRFFLQFGLTVVFATLFSLVMSFTLTPMLSAVFLKRIQARRDAKGAVDAAPDTALEQGHWMDRQMRKLAGAYRGLLAWSLARMRHRVLLGAVTVGLLAFSFWILGVAGGEFMPRSDNDYVQVDLSLPVGSSLAAVEAVAAEVESILDAVPEKISVLSTIGGAERGINEAMIRARMVPKGERARSTQRIAMDLRPQLAGLPGAEVTVSPVEMFGGGGQADFELAVMGEETGVLRGISERLVAFLREQDGFVDVQDSWEPGGTELVFVPDREEIARRGLATGQVAMYLRNAYEGDDTSVFREAGEEYAIRVQLADAPRNDPRTLRRLRVPTEDGPVPLDQLGRVEARRGEAEILHLERQKQITISANLAGITAAEAMAVLQPELDAIALPPGYKFDYTGMAEVQSESFASLFQAMILAVILTYVVLAMILESFVHPLTVMITLPLGLIGSAWGLFFGNQTVNVMSLMAMVMLVGIVVNNAILLLDYVAQLRRRGQGLGEAILAGCPERLRAVVMTNLATAIALVPQTIGHGAGIEMRLPIAFVTIGGVLVSAVFTLVLIPSLYYTVERMVQRLRRRPVEA